MCVCLCFVWIRAFECSIQWFASNHCIRWFCRWLDWMRVVSTLTKCVHTVDASKAVCERHIVFSFFLSSSCVFVMCNDMLDDCLMILMIMFVIVVVVEIMMVVDEFSMQMTFKIYVYTWLYFFFLFCVSEWSWALICIYFVFMVIWGVRWTFGSAYAWKQSTLWRSMLNKLLCIYVWSCSLNNVCVYSIKFIYSRSVFCLFFQLLHKVSRHFLFILLAACVFLSIKIYIDLNMFVENVKSGLSIEVLNRVFFLFFFCFSWDEKVNIFNKLLSFVYVNLRQLCVRFRLHICFSKFMAAQQRWQATHLLQFLVGWTAF